MNQDIIDRLHYSYDGENQSCYLPVSLKDSYYLISEYFKKNKNNKLCLVYPSKEYMAQWLTVPIVLDNLKNDFQIHQKEIYNSFSKYKCGDKLILNQGSIVEWAYKTTRGVTFKVVDKTGCETFFSIGFSGAFKLQPAPKSRNKLSSLDRVKKDLPKKGMSSLDKVLDIDSFGNNLFQKSSICLVGKFKYYENSIENILLNQTSITDYFRVGKLDENGNTTEQSPLILANSFSSLRLFTSETISIPKIIIDGFNILTPRGDFSDLDNKYRTPTILITDLSEIEYFEDIKNLGFDFFNFSKTNLKTGLRQNYSVFKSLETKLDTYITFVLIKEVCNNPDIEALAQKVFSIEKDESNNDLTTLKIALVRLTNLISRIVSILTPEEIIYYNSKIELIDSLFLKNKLWLGDSCKTIEECIKLSKSIIGKCESSPSEKCKRFISLLESSSFDYIICPSEDEVRILRKFINSSEFSHRPQVVSSADVNDNLLSNGPVRALLTGWSKIDNMNRILHSFLFSELVVLFYEFEKKYWNSLQKRNITYIEHIRPTIDKNGAVQDKTNNKLKGFEDLFTEDDISEIKYEGPINIVEIELTFSNAQYSKYKTKGDFFESIKAKRIDFENDYFIYSSESHKFLLINELIDKGKLKTNIYRKRIENLATGDIIAFINTDKDVLVELVEKNTNTKELSEVKRWTELWKDLLKEYYIFIGSDFRKLVDDMRKNGCKKHEGTIKTWLVDENRIGPDDNADLVSIATMTNSQLLKDNIIVVRDSIRKMIGWRMKASDFITERIKSQIHMVADSTIINKRISVEGLGSVIVLKVVEISNVWDNIDIKYVNRLLTKEFL
jgi:hypothetical protein